MSMGMFPAKNCWNGDWRFGVSMGMFPAKNCAEMEIWSEQGHVPRKELCWIGDLGCVGTCSLQRTAGMEIGDLG